MRIFPVNCSKNYINTCCVNPSIANHPRVSFKGLERGAFSDRLNHMLYNDFVNKMILCGDINALEYFMPRLKSLKGDLFKKLEEYDLGTRLIQKIFLHYIVAKEDISEFAKGMREGIIAAGFVNYSQVTGVDKETEKSCANTYLADNWDKIHHASKLLGQNTLLYATRLKRTRFEKLLSDVDAYLSKTTMFALKNMLVQKLNPLCSEKYQRLQIEKEKVLSSFCFSKFNDFYSKHEENKAKIKELECRIKELKQNFSVDSKQKIKELYKEITAIRRRDFEAKPEELFFREKIVSEIKAQQSKILRDAEKDPQKKIELFYLYNVMSKYDVSMAESLDDFINNNATEESADLLKSHVVLCVLDFLDLNDKVYELFYRLKINESPYFSKILEADLDTRENLKILFSILANADGDINTAFEALQQNKKTREIFEGEGYDYDVWSNYDENRDLIRIDEKTVIKKVDMKNIKQSLFLGNQVGCCTAIGSGSKALFAPNYVMNNFLQSIELVVNEKPVGNTMCYLARKDDVENILVLDNIEVLPRFRYDKKYLAMFVHYARKLAYDIGAPDIEIYAGHRNDFVLDQRKSICCLTSLAVLGSSGEQAMFLDSIPKTNYVFGVGKPLLPLSIFKNVFLYKLNDESLKYYAYNSD